MNVGMGWASGFYVAWSVVPHSVNNFYDVIIVHSAEVKRRLYVSLLCL